MTDDTLEGDGLFEKTKNVMYRWEWLNTVLALVLVTSVPIFIAYFLTTGTALIVPQAWFALYATLVITAAVWAFGKSAVSTATKLVRNK